MERGKGVGEKVNRGRPRRAGGLRALSRSEEAQRGRSKGGLGGMTRRRRGKAKAEQAASSICAREKGEQKGHLMCGVHPSAARGKGKEAGSAGLVVRGLGRLSGPWLRG